MRKILIVDDDHSVAAARQEVRKHKGYDSVIANSGANGLKAIGSSHFDLAIIDLMMPDMDGIGTIRAFHKCAPMLPIILMTGYAFSAFRGPTPDFFGMAAKLGASHCLHKPIQPRKLLDA